MMAYIIGRSCCRKNRQTAGLLLAFCILVAAGPILGGAYWLTGPEVVKLDWNTRALTAADVNSDGLVDLLVIDNDAAKIDILYQTKDGKPPPDLQRIIRRNRWEPVLEDACFKNDPFVSGETAYDLAAGDLNGDGKIDIAYTGDIVPLTVRFQGKDGTFSDEWTYDHLTPLTWTGSMAITDIDGDGKNELVVLAKKKICIFAPSGTGRLILQKTCRLSSDENYALMTYDINGDGRRDLSYFVHGTNAVGVVVRFQNSASGFGPEVPIRSENDFSDLVMFPGDKKQPVFAAILTRTAMIKTFQFVRKPSKSGPSMELSIYSSDNTSQDSALYATGDFNGDGLRDMAVGDPGGARILLYFGREQGGFAEAKAFPTVSNLTAIDRVRMGKGRPDGLLVISEKESIVGLSVIRPGGRNRLPFPDILKVDGKPLTGAAINDIDRPGTDDIVVLSRRSDGNNIMQIIPPQIHRKEPPLFTMQIKDMRRDPRGMYVMDLNNDHREDLVLLIPREPARIFARTPAGELKEVAVDSVVRKGTMDDLNLSRIGKGDVDGDGADELLVAATGFVRALRLDSDNNIKIVDQLNSAQQDAALAVPRIADIDHDGHPEMLVYLADKSSMEVFRRGTDDIFRSTRFIPVPDIDIQGALRFDADGQAHIAYLGSDRFWDVRFSGSSWQTADIVPPYETDLKNVKYSALATGNFDGDGKDDLVAIDGKSHILEILARDKRFGFKSRMHFTVFDENVNYRIRRGSAEEPREIVVNDFSGDGKDDIALLVHDRVLVYIQK